MPEVLVATPLKYSVATRAYEFPEGISIREISLGLSIVKGYVSERDKRKMDDARFWLCAVQEDEYVGPVTGDELYTGARSAALALQIISPSGGMPIFLKFQRTDNGI